MTDQLKPAAYILCKHGMIAAGDYQEYLQAVIVGESEDGDKEIEGYLKHGMATPLYEIPEGYQLLNIADLRSLTFSFDSREKLEAMLKVAGDQDD